MLEMMLCSLFTLLPDYLYRRYVQGKRFGKEITLYSVWFELRWGITGCLILTVLLITTVFYNHPSTTNVTLFFRTVPILPETIGRVAEVNRRFNGLGQERSTDFPAGQFEAGGCGRDGAAQGRRDRSADAGRAGRRREGRRPAREAKGAQQQAATSSRPSRSCSGATPATCLPRDRELAGARARDARRIAAATARSRASRSGSRRYCRPRRRAPKPSSPRLRSNSTRRSSGPAWTGVSSSSRCASATSSIR